jgi:5-methylthioadenosine/S-adenosylhomocysteine deaminase
MTILIKQVLTELGIKDILINGNRIAQIADKIDFDADEILDGKNKAILPSFFNGHTHLAMTLFRSLADDMALKPWLEEKIWPLEAKLTEEDVYWGTKLACLELIRSGTTMVIDMYHHFNGTARAVDEMGLRGIIAPVQFDFFNDKLKDKLKSDVVSLFEDSKKYSDRITFGLGPHAIYTVSEESLIWLKVFADEHNLTLNIHLSETEEEFKNSLTLYGLTPTGYLDKIGFLGPNVTVSHCIYLTDEDIEILAKRNVKVMHIPISNLKLASGEDFRFHDLQKAGVIIGLGTDGASSSNNLDILDVVKMVSLKQKMRTSNPSFLPARESLSLVTDTTEVVIGMKIGKIEEGYLADLCLVNLRIPEMMPNHNFVSNLVYSANGLAVDTLICDGKILMKNRIIPGEDEILNKIPEVVKDWLSR